MEIIFNKQPYFDLRIRGLLFEVGWFRGDEWKFIEISLLDFAFWGDTYLVDIFRLQILKFSILISYDTDWVGPEEE